MKILHLITTLEPGGAEKQLMHLTREQSLKGEEVYIAFLKGEGTLEKHIQVNNVHVIKKLANKSLTWQYIILLTLVRKLKPDIVHCHLPRSEILGALSRLIFRNKLILSKHNSEKFWPNAPGLISKCIAIAVNHRADAIICISNATKNYLFDIRELRTRKNLFVVHYGIPKLIEGQSSSKNHNSYGTLRLLTFSRLVDQKNLKNVIWAISVLNSNQQETNLEIYGDGPLKFQLNNQILNLNLAEKVRILNPVLDSDDILAKCDIFLLVSLYEGFGLSALEALRMKKPIIASNHGALKEVLGSNYPYLVDPLRPDSIAATVEKVKSDLVLGQTPDFSLIVERFSIEDKASQISEVYKLIIQHG
jgi:glycosyltransferase involved in cell wall biosynthesis